MITYEVFTLHTGNWHGMMDQYSFSQMCNREIEAWIKDNIANSECTCAEHEPPFIVRVIFAECTSLAFLEHQDTVLVESANYQVQHVYLDGASKRELDIFKLKYPNWDCLVYKKGQDNV